MYLLIDYFMDTSFLFETKQELEQHLIEATHTGEGFELYEVGTPAKKLDVVFNISLELRPKEVQS